MMLTSSVALKRFLIRTAVNRVFRLLQTIDSWIWNGRFNNAVLWYKETHDDTGWCKNNCSSNYYCTTKVTNSWFSTNFLLLILCGTYATIGDTWIKQEIDCKHLFSSMDWVGLTVKYAHEQPKFSVLTLPSFFSAIHEKLMILD